uniref:Photosystem II reaction center protein M n=1 Tax=Phaeomonas parva TaxID=124430 RepID=A0A7S1TR89_9STRA|mmetsp:Transcript_7068/g.23202  ORF Transcript_7068/g.23202 Transcript_7068/m.23202 type:complete len:105 (+) Transcript_7068:117-431(+)
MMSLGARVATLACLFVAINAFVAPPQKFPGRAMSSATQHQMSPVDVAMAADSLSVVSQLPTQLVSLEVTTAAFLAVLLGTFFPVFFLITLYIQSEGYKAGNPDA